MNHGKHLYLMVGLVALAAVLFFTGVGGGGLVLLLLIGGCAAMMFFMMGGMGGMGRGEQHDRPGADQRHDLDQHDVADRYRGADLHKASGTRPRDRSLPSYDDHDRRG